MSESIKLVNNKYLDTSSIYDSTKYSTDLNSVINTIEAKNLIRVYHTQISIDSSGTATLNFGFLPIDCGIVIVSIRGTAVASGGVAAFLVGYFNVKIAQTLHNTFSNIALDGHTGDETLTISGEAATYNVSILYFNFNYGTGYID